MNRIPLVSTTTAKRGYDIVLHRTDVPFGPAHRKEEPPMIFDGHRSRLLFEVKGANLSGWGAVGGNVLWRNQYNQTDLLAQDAQPLLSVWADLFVDPEHRLQPVTLRGVEYAGGAHYRERESGTGSFHVEHWHVARADYDKVTDAADSAMHEILGAVRGLFLDLPGVRDALIDRSVRGAIGGALLERDQAEKRITDLRALQARINDTKEA